MKVGLRKGSLFLFLLLFAGAANAQTFTNPVTVNLVTSGGYLSYYNVLTSQSAYTYTAPTYTLEAGSSFSFLPIFDPGYTDIFTTWTWIAGYQGYPIPPVGNPPVGVGYWVPNYPVTLETTYPASSSSPSYRDTVRIYADAYGVYTLNNIQNNVRVLIAAKKNTFENPVVQRRVDLPAGNIYDLSPGSYYVGSGKDFPFRILPEDGLKPDVTLTRLLDGALIEGGVEISKEADAAGFYIVTLLKVQQNVVVNIDFISKSKPTGNEAIAASKVWAKSGTLYVTSANEARVYNLTGALVKVIPSAAGATNTAQLSKGIYLVVAEGKTYKVLVD
ncbi:MAG: hypothetical protein LBN11_08125 [Tannerella sp.]|nr:hypothetical protein [Tannerella sp.]